MNNPCLKEIPTCQLVEELASREGVEEYTVDPHEPFAIQISGENQAPHSSGPARILYVYD